MSATTQQITATELRITERRVSYALVIGELRKYGPCKL